MVNAAVKYTAGYARTERACASEPMPLGVRVAKSSVFLSGLVDLASFLVAGSLSACSGLGPRALGPAVLAA